MTVELAGDHLHTIGKYGEDVIGTWSAGNITWSDGCVWYRQDVNLSILGDLSDVNEWMQC
eukprot:CAMPEP_0179033928 /NCGR_PEP_ID=MMETSP0796-20121207/12349_1 /TAXON_ID=73915 /ORGANISM="Pyrodinium bahamense, Strain pbaha01" /LENGTH=59 /DNA_ID=CAMNT_0020730187 /DNA_START=22 /DNA_END=198 /DNA_ORIENTATION=-